MTTAIDVIDAAENDLTAKPIKIQQPELMKPDGTPTPFGWRRIADALQQTMDTKSRPGRGSRTFKYITARNVQDRLDSVVGPGNWCTSFRVLDIASAAVECTLTIFGVSKSDVGFANNPEHPEDEALKSGYSDAFKRAAVHWGIGRWIYDD